MINSKSSVKYAKLYKDKATDEWYMHITYIIDNDRQTVEIDAPRVYVPLKHSSIERKDCKNSMVGIVDEGFVIYCRDPYDTQFTIMPSPDESRNLITTKVIKEKTQKMTISEIEEKLGYKIEIVSEKDSEDNH